LNFGEASDSRQTVELFYREDWDCVILDIDLPGRTGLELLEEFAKAKPNVPVIILTGYPETVYGVRAIKAGAKGYLSKTSAYKEIAIAVERATSGKKYISNDLADQLASVIHIGSDAAPHESLSNRELQVMRMLASGKSNSQIASELSLSEQSVSTYRSRLFQKIGLYSNVEIARYAIENKLIQ
jgi:two-component system, NarL family, invasion response regulator UvrY